MGGILAIYIKVKSQRQSGTVAKKLGHVVQADRNFVL